MHACMYVCIYTYMGGRVYMYVYDNTIYVIICMYIHTYIHTHTQVPIFELHDESTHLNAYCLDFFKHGQIDALEIYNKMNRDRLWEHLQSFLLMLEALTAAMQRRHSSNNEGQNTLFDDQNVLDTFEAITSRFSAQMRQSAA